MIALNCNHTVHLAKLVVPAMVARGRGRVLVTASVVSTAPAPYQTVYGATKAFVMSFAEGLRVELDGTGVTVTALQPGATETRFFERAHMMDTKVGQARKDDPAGVARRGFEAMMAGKDAVLGGELKSRLQGLANEVLPEKVKAAQVARTTRARLGQSRSRAEERVMKSLEAFRELDPGPERGDRLSRAIGWSSVGIGAAQIAAPAAIARVIGLEPDGRASLAARVMGLTNLAIGAGLIVRPRRGSRMWARIAGDALGAGLLALTASGRRASDRRVVTALATSGALLALDALAARRLLRGRTAPVPLAFAVTINKPPAEVYAFFRRFENLPRFMDYLESVETQGSTRSHWKARLPLGRIIEWDAEITEDRPDELIAWQTVGRSLFAHRGRVTFASAPGDSGTEVRVSMEIGLPGMSPSATLGNLLTRPQIKGDLRRLKQVMEAGEVLLSDASAVRGKHPAQPSERAARRARERSRRLSGATAKEPEAKEPEVRP